MDIDERQSNASPERWKAFHFSTLLVCFLGVLGNVSSLVVLKRHLSEIAGSRLLLALAVADLGVVSAIASRTLSYVTYGNSQLTQVLEWWFLYWYYCSIYMTVFLSLDRYLHTSKSMFLRKINYKKFLKRAILAMFVIVLLISLPHLLGSCVQYFYGFHLVRIKACPIHLNLCNLSSSSIWEIHTCGDTRPPALNVSHAELGEYQPLVNTMCNGLTTRGPRTLALCLTTAVHLTNDNFLQSCLNTSTHSRYLQRFLLHWSEYVPLLGDLLRWS